MTSGVTLVIDVGNSRVKWGMHGPHGWTAFGSVSNGEIGTLSLRDWQNLPRPVRIVGVNVAGDAMRIRLETQLARWRVVPRWLAASASAGGVVNGYATPAQLGADRWAALVAARRRVSAGPRRASPAVVVNAGTAVTIDALDSDGVFIGGLILAGMRLMLQALAEKTAALDVAPGVYSAFPTSTGDALYSGAVLAVAGAIDQVRMRLQEKAERQVVCFLAGGAAEEIAAYLNPPFEVVDNLVLEGVLALADET